MFNVYGSCRCQSFPVNLVSLFLSSSEFSVPVFASPVDFVLF